MVPLFRYGLRVHVYKRVKPRTRIETYIPVRETAGFVLTAQEGGAVDKIFFVWPANKLLTGPIDSGRSYWSCGHYR